MTTRTLMAWTFVFAFLCAVFRKPFLMVLESAMNCGVLFEAFMRPFKLYFWLLNINYPYTDNKIYNKELTLFGSLMEVVGFAAVIGITIGLGKLVFIIFKRIKG